MTFTAAPNTGAQRTGSLTIAGRTFTVTQPTLCSYSITPNSRSFTSVGGTGTTAVTAPAGCAWTAVSDVAWITVTAGASGVGNGTVSIFVAANLSGKRTGTVTIASETFTVEQAKP